MPGLGRHADIGKPGRIAQGDEVALVGVERVRAWVWRDDSSALLPRRPQRGVGRIVERKIGEAVIDKIDGLTVVKQPRTIPDELCRIGDDGPDTVGLEQAAEQLELGRQILLCRLFVDDGDAPQWTVAAGQMPLLKEHGDEAGLDIVRLTRLRHEFGHRIAARTLRRCQPRIEQAATGVGVDLDQLRAVVADVKVVTEEDTARRASTTCRSWCPAEHTFLPGRQGNNRLHRSDQFGHVLHVATANEDDGIGKEMRPGFAQFAVEGFLAQRLFQRRVIERNAGAVTVEDFGSRFAVVGERSDQFAHAGAPAIAPASKNSTTSANSRVRFIGGRLRQTRLP